MVGDHDAEAGSSGSIPRTSTWPARDAVIAAFRTAGPDRSRRAPQTRARPSRTTSRPPWTTSRTRRKPATGSRRSGRPRPRRGRPRARAGSRRSSPASPSASAASDGDRPRSPATARSRAGARRPGRCRRPSRSVTIGMPIPIPPMNRTPRSAMSRMKSSRGSSSLGTSGSAQCSNSGLSGRRPSWCSRWSSTSPIVGSTQIPRRRDHVGDRRVVVVGPVADRVVGPPHAAVDDRVDAGLGADPVADRGQRVGQDRQPQPVRLVDGGPAASRAPYCCERGFDVGV